MDAFAGDRWNSTGSGERAVSVTDERDTDERDIDERDIDERDAYERDADDGVR